MFADYLEQYYPLRNATTLTNVVLSNFGVLVGEQSFVKYTWTKSVMPAPCVSARENGICLGKSARLARLQEAEVLQTPNHMPFGPTISRGGLLYSRFPGTRASGAGLTEYMTLLR